MKFKTTSFYLYLSLMLSLGVYAADVETVKAGLLAKIPKLKIDSLSPTPIPELYELISNGSLIYVSADGEYLIDGEMLESSTGVNLTEQRRGGLILDAIASLGDDVIRFEGDKNAETQGEIFVFTDHTCGYCQKLHREISAINEAGISVNYLLYPRAGKGSKVHKEMIAVWCSKDQQAALTAAKQGQAPAFDQACDNPIEKHMQIAELAGLRGTPMIVSAKGQVVPGYLPAEEIERLVASEALLD